MVLDGEPVVRKVVTSILEAAGFSVHATSELDAVIQLCRENLPALVITNVFLPGITGHDAMRVIKAHCREVPVLMVSGLPAQDVIEEWINKDGFDVFPKPFTPDSLVMKVKEMLQAPDKARSA